LKVNGALEVLNRFPNINVPTFSDQLIAISNRAQEAQSAVQDLRTTVANIKAGAITKAETAVTKITARIDTPLARIQSTINAYQAKVTSAQGRVTSTTNTILTWLLVFAISVTILSLIVAAALLLFFLYCLQFVIHGRFPSMRVVVNKGGRDW
jgi:predicted PurR-regulated permease PerM